MTHRSSGRTRAGYVLVMAVIAMSMQTVAARGREDGNTRIQNAVNPTAAALVEFQQRLDRYLDLRRSLSKQLSSTADAAQLATRQDALAAALRTARRTAKRGDLIPGAAAVTMSRTITADLKRRGAGSGLVLSEVRDAPMPTINATYPADAPLATIPPLLLNSLPRLPENLQYRFFGRHLLILDGDVQIVLDFIPNVLPRTLR